jgi:hypothetical protein
MDICRSETPRLLPVVDTPDRQVACHLFTT